MDEQPGGRTNVPIQRWLPEQALEAAVDPDAVGLALHGWTEQRDAPEAQPEGQRRKARRQDRDEQLPPAERRARDQGARHGQAVVG